MQKFHWVVTDDPFLAAGYADNNQAAVKISTTGVRTYRANNQILVSNRLEEDRNNITRIFTSHFGRRRGEEVLRYLEETKHDGDVYFITCVTPFIMQVLKDSWKFRFKDMDVPTQNWVGELESQLLGSNTIHKAASVALVTAGNVAGMEVKMIKSLANPNKAPHRATGMQAPPCPYRTSEPVKKPEQDQSKAHLFPKRSRDSDYKFPSSGKFVPNYQDTSLEEATKEKETRAAISAETRARWSDTLATRFPTKK